MADLRGRDEETRQLRYDAIANRRTYHIKPLKDVERLRMELDDLTPETPSTCSILSGAEYRCLKFVALGLTNEQIAARLFVERQSVKNTLTSVYKKMGRGKGAQPPAGRATRNATYCSYLLGLAEALDIIDPDRALTKQLHASPRAFRPEDV